ncbi:hypothetical protein [Levilactobacillus tongjiangensis]|uniref:Extracellular protein n=1 Tax=Levilactobacillus tongjiangensis TaxID=2486023 RepID=A0ABW1SUP3_9LACO|nr:hypothetical protein [Levilactobacillus tongjiangensis]
MKTKKMIIATATLLAAVGMGSGTAISQAGLGVDQASAKSVRHIATPKSYKKLAKKAVHVSKGNLYSSAKLSKISHKAKNYRHTTFYRTKQAKVVKANKKTAVYNYIKSSNGKTKGWIWHGYVKNGKAPKAKTSKAVATSAKSKSSSSVSSSNKISKSKLKSISNAVNNTNKPSVLNNWVIKPGKKGSGALTDSKGYLKPAKGTKLYSIGGGTVIGTLSNGHRIMGNSYHPSKYLEVMPGMHSNSENFTNNSGHWVAYYISGDGLKGTAAAPHKGFKYMSGMDQGLISGFDGVWLGKNSNSDSALYNWGSKILLINKKAAQAKFF